MKKRRIMEVQKIKEEDDEDEDGDSDSDYSYKGDDNIKIKRKNIKKTKRDKRFIKSPNKHNQFDTIKTSEGNNTLFESSDFKKSVSYIKENFYTSIPFLFLI